MATTTKPERKDVYQIVSDQILAALEKGTVPWKKPWASRGGMKNVRGTAYRGVNQFLLQCISMDKGYKSNLWLTFNQARAAGGSVRKGEKGTPVVFWKMLKKAATPTTEEKSFMMLKYYTVFNVDQCDGVTVPAETTVQTTVEPLAACEAVVANMPKRPTMKEGGDMACFRPSTDEVFMPARAAFSKSEDYYSTLFHELGHATGHASRLARKGVTDMVAFGNHTYGQEELVAEFCAAFLCGMTGIAPATVENSASYIEHWKKAVRLDNKLVVMACAQAQKAADFVLGTNQKEEEDAKDSDEG